MLDTRTTLGQRLVPGIGTLEHPLVRDGLLAVAGTALLALCAQISFPLPTSRQKRSPTAPSTVTRSPSTSGVARGPAGYAIPYSTAHSCFQSSLPVAASSATNEPFAPRP